MYGGFSKNEALTMKTPQVSLNLTKATANQASINMIREVPSKAKSGKSGGGTVLDRPRVKPKKQLGGGGKPPNKPPIYGGGGDDDDSDPKDKRRITEEEKYALKGDFAQNTLQKVLTPV